MCVSACVYIAGIDPKLSLSSGPRVPKNPAITYDWAASRQGFEVCVGGGRGEDSF